MWFLKNIVTVINFFFYSQSFTIVYINEFLDQLIAAIIFYFQNFIAFADLGDFYAYFLKDNLKSEVYYKLAISIDPKQAYLYTQLADVYRYFFKDLDKARAIVDQGLQKVPNDPNLLQYKAALSASTN